MGGVCSGGVAKVKSDPGGKVLDQSVSELKNEVGPDRRCKNQRKKPSKRKLKKFPVPNRKAASKVTPEKENSFVGRRASIAGLDKAVDLLDTLGSKVSNLNPGSGFLSGVSSHSQGSRISILAFEVANTIVKGSNLMQFLSTENIRYLKKEILQSQGVRRLVSQDITELLILAAGDKREELQVFSREVIRFGNLCKDPQWHNLGGYFSRFNFEDADHQPHRADAAASMHELTTLAQNTSELYHELQALDRFEQDYRQKAEEFDSLNLPRKGEGFMMLHNEVRRQRKLVRSLKKKSLWSKNFEEIMEKLVDSVGHVHHAISEAFGDDGETLPCQDAKKDYGLPQRLGVSGLALHYANVINQIDTLASRPMSLPRNTRDSLYHDLPPSVKKALRRNRNLHGAKAKDELTATQIQAEMEKTLQWLVPLATNTIKSHRGFGWVGEWANNGSTNELGKNLIRLQTLYHADKQKMDLHILELVTWLHRLIILVRSRDHPPYKQLLQFQSQNPIRPLDLHSD